MLNGDDIVIVRKRNQKLFTRTHKEDDDLKKLRLDAISNKYENKTPKYIDVKQILILCWFVSISQYFCKIFFLFYSSPNLPMFPNDFGTEHYITSDDRLSMNRGAGYGFDGLPKLSNGNNGGGTKSQASTASSSATRDSGISVTDAQRAADEHRCTFYTLIIIF